MTATKVGLPSIVSGTTVSRGLKFLWHIRVVGTVVPSKFGDNPRGEDGIGVS